MFQELVAQYGLAGLVVIIFYFLMRNELRHLRHSIDRLDYRIGKLVVAIERLVGRLEPEE